MATSHLSEAILDRFELIKLDYQSEREEIDIVLSNLRVSPLPPAERERFASLSVHVVRATKGNPSIRRGASLRAAISIADIGVSLMSTGIDLEQAVLEALGWHCLRTSNRGALATSWGQSPAPPSIVWDFG